MVNIYTDVAFQKEKAAATVLALSDKDFIGYYTFVFDKIPNSTYGELLAVREGLRALHLNADEEYVVHTDSSSALHFLCRPDVKHRSKECLEVAKEILRDVKGYKVKFSLCVGHLDEHSPNKVVDKASRYILRSVMKEGQ